MTLRADEKAHLKISVLTAGGEVRRTWVKEKGTRLSVVWGGRGEDSDLGDGRYTIVGKATDRAGLSRSSKGATLVDTQAPKIHWKHPRPRVTNGLERETFRFRSEDRSPRVHLHLEAFDHTGLVARTKNVRRGEGDGHIKWKPHYANGRALTPGRFTARLRVTDDAGNSMVSGRTKWRVYRDVKAKAYSRMEDVGSRVALTFDDCLEENAWSRILATLRNFRAHGTFFCPGQYVYRYPEMARRSVADGNTIGSHAWDHALLTNKSAYQTEWRLEKDRKAWWEVTGDSPAPFFRPPYGGYDSDVLEGAGNASFPRVILWDVDPQDWRRPSPATIAAKVLDNVQPGSIVLMHVLDHTASALPTIMRGLQRRGLTPVTLAEMFRAGGLR
jgi:peptidoglycan/xylan/chitin deacetylase (PgdA/CDA1 family)